MEKSQEENTMVTDEMVESAARAICEAWHYSKIGTPDGDAEWRKKQDQYRKQARAALEAALSAQEQDVARDLPSEFEKWWNDNVFCFSGVAKMTYTQRKQLAWDAFYSVSFTASKHRGAE